MSVLRPARRPAAAADGFASPGWAEAPIRARTIHADALVRVADVRCAPDPPRLGPEEVASTVEVVLPLSGAFVRQLDHAGRRRTIVGDPTTALVFRPEEPYRVAHPAGGSDRSIAIALGPAAQDELGCLAGDLPDAVVTGPAADLFLRRWLRGVERGVLDDLGAAEGAAVILDGLFGRAPLPQPGRDRLVDAVRLELAANLAARVTLADLGRTVGASPFHLARRFRAATGMTIHGWRTALRVREALTRIDAGERDLTTLALDLGFAHHSHLTNTVRAATGRPPSALRPDPTPAELAALRTILQA